MSVKARSLMVGMATYVPELRGLTGMRTGGTASARYCYSVWLRHLSILQRRLRRASLLHDGVCG